MVKRKRKTITRRTQERIHRLAYDLEDMAIRARHDGKRELADWLAFLSTSTGKLARDDSVWGLK